MNILKTFELETLNVNCEVCELYLSEVVRKEVNYLYLVTNKFFSTCTLILLEANLQGRFPEVELLAKMF